LPFSCRIAFDNRLFRAHVARQNRRSAADRVKGHPKRFRFLNAEQFCTILALDMLCILKSIVAWAVLTFVSTNLIGFVVRGILWSPPDVEAPDERVAELFRHETRRMSVGNVAMTLLTILVTAAYLFVLFHFWNVWLPVAALLAHGDPAP
jgi:hypothetical protein